MNAFVLYEGDHLLVAVKASPEAGRGVCTAAIRKDGVVKTALIESPSRETSEMIRIWIKSVGERISADAILRVLIDPDLIKKVRCAEVEKKVVRNHYLSIAPANKRAEVRRAFA